METQESFWFSTKSGLFRGPESAWVEIAAYGPSIARWLERRYPRLAPQEREDLVQDLLVEMHERLVPTHDRSRGRFRQLLQVAIRHRAIDRLRRKAAAPLPEEEPVAPETDEIDAIELETALVHAVFATRDELMRGPEADLAALYALADRVVHGRTDATIAAESGVSIDRVARLLRKVRERIIRHLLEIEIDPPLEPHHLERAAAAVRDALQRPRERTAILQGLEDRVVGERIESFLERFAAARERFPSLDSPAGVELRRSLEFLLT